MAFQGLTFGICGIDRGDWQTIEKEVGKLGGHFLLEGTSLPAPVDYIVSTDGCIHPPATNFAGRYVPKHVDLQYVSASWVSTCSRVGGASFEMGQVLVI